MNTDAFLDNLADLFTARDLARDAGRPLSAAAHMLQTAAAARAADADDTLIAACLLHDVGHWLHARPADAMARGEDGRHEEIGAHYLAPYFDTPVTRAIALHVAAKRYLCATEPDYFQKLSPGSVRTLELQGGPMDVEEVAAFRAIPDRPNAVAIRR